MPDLVHPHAEEDPGEEVTRPGGDDEEGAADLVARLRDALAHAGLDFDWVATSASGDGVRLAQEGVRAGRGLIVAVGGDGTVNEVVNGVTDADGLALATTGAVLTGRGRDACRNFGVPTRWQAVTTAPTPATRPSSLQCSKSGPNSSGAPPITVLESPTMTSSLRGRQARGRSDRDGDSCGCPQNKGAHQWLKGGGEHRP